MQNLPWGIDCHQSSRANLHFIRYDSLLLCNLHLIWLPPKLMMMFWLIDCLILSCLLTFYAFHSLMMCAHHVHRSYTISILLATGLHDSLLCYLFHDADRHCNWESNYISFIPNWKIATLHFNCIQFGTALRSLTLLVPLSVFVYPSFPSFSSLVVRIQLWVNLLSLLRYADDHLCH